MSNFHIYIRFPAGVENLITSNQEGRRFLKDIQILLDRADCEKGSVLYYNGAERDVFFNEMGLLQEEDLLGFFGTLDFNEVIAFLLYEANATNWTENPIHDVKEEVYYYRQWLSANRAANEDCPIVLKEMAERHVRIQGSNNTEKCLFLNIFRTPPILEPILIVRGTYQNSALINIESVSNFSELDNWFLVNRIERNYNHNDNRHIEGHPQYISGKSPLLGGLGGKQNASELLMNALGDQRKRKYLVNYDQGNTAYIRYEDENALDQYHGYHLVKPTVHERDIDAEDEIPGRVKDILKYRKALYSNFSPKNYSKK